MKLLSSFIKKSFALVLVKILGIMMNSQIAEKKNIVGMSQACLESFFKEQGEKPFRAQQILQWVHQSFLTDFDEMTNLSKELRAKMQSWFYFPEIEVVSHQVSIDGTEKWLIKTEDKRSAVEIVLIPEETRKTLCISSQVGCELNCQFCHTATQGFDRNLSSGEIVSQLWFVQSLLLKRQQSEPLNPKHSPVTNVVFMGMGEPLRNCEAVLIAASIFISDFAYGLSKRRVTISTSGVVPGLEKMIEKTDVALALSLHAPNDDLRSELVPINKKYPIDLLMTTVSRYLKQSQRQMHVTIEYVMLDGVNDHIQHAQQLSKLIGRYVSGQAKVNLIPFNSYPTARYRCSSDNQIKAFAEVLRSKHIITTIRKTRGPDILGACGQLAGDVLDKTRRRQKYLQETSQQLSEVKASSF